MILHGEMRSSPPESPAILPRIKCPMWNNAYKSINHCVSCKWHRMKELRIKGDNIIVRCEGEGDPK